MGRFIQPDTLVPDYFNPLDWDRYAYGLNNPSRYTDPTGHAAICFDCGGASLEKILESFTKYGKHGSLFNEYYAQVYFAEEVLADSLVDSVIDENDLINLKAHEDTMKITYDRALNFVKPKDFTLSMLNNNQSNIVSRALSLASNVEGNVITFPKAQNETAGVSTYNSLESAFAVVIFGHGARHLFGLGLGQAEVEAAIAAQVNMIVDSSSSFPGPFWGRVIVNGQIIEYRAYPSGSSTVHIGTYYPPEEH